MNGLDVSKHHDVSFDDYKGWFEKYKKNNDVREINFQNGVVKRLISAICPNLDVENIEKKGPDSDIHDYLQYCGTYIDQQGIEKSSTPDLVIANDWNWLNKENSVDYRAVVEVKSPYLNQRIYNKDYEKYGEDIKNQLSCHLSAKNNDKAILTDAMKWEFYKKNEEGNELVPVRTIELYDLIDGRGHWEWKKSEQAIVKDNVITERIVSHNEQPLVKEFEDLKEFTKKF
uniref:hypothetical protein n=1 Tax=Virgibacillus sp. LDC-1 TaxID=3039856 RepID=UPI0024DEA0FD